MTPSRQPIEVAVGVLIDPDGRFLMTSRPAGKLYAGYWEFPGGKLEPLESVHQALKRELQEELGIQIGSIYPWRSEQIDDPHALVLLHFCKVFDWKGTPQMLEHQKMSWQTLPVSLAPVLPGALPALEWLSQESPLSLPPFLPREP